VTIIVEAQSEPVTFSALLNVDGRLNIDGMEHFQFVICVGQKNVHVKVFHFNATWK